MIAQHQSPPRTGETAAPVTADSRNDAFTRMLETKVEQGYTIESLEGTRAVIATRSRQRRFGLGHRAAPAREIVEIDSQGKFTSRKHP